MSIPANATLADLGEFGLIGALTERFPQGDHVLIGPGDDAAVVAVPDGRVVVSTDLHVDTRHFRRDWASAAEIGHRVAAANLSDLNAMGGRATALTIGLAAPADLPVAWALELADGIVEECALVGASVVGGDLTSADQVMIAVTVLGSVAGEPVRRSGARPGDVLAIAGRQGWAAGGLAVLARGFRSPRKLVEAYKRPEPPYGAGAQAAALGRDGDDRRVRRAAGRRRAPRRGERGGDRRTLRAPSRSPSRCRPSARPWGPTRCGSSSPGGDDHCPGRDVPGRLAAARGLVGDRRGRRGVRVTVDGAAYDGPAGHTHF